MNCKDCNQTIELHALECFVCKKVAGDRSRCLHCAWSSACHRCGTELPHGENICESCFNQLEREVTQNSLLISN